MQLVLLCVFNNKHVCVTPHFVVDAACLLLTGEVAGCCADGCCPCASCHSPPTLSCVCSQVAAVVLVVVVAVSTSTLQLQHKPHHSTAAFVSAGAYARLLNTSAPHSETFTVLCLAVCVVWQTPIACR